MENKMNWGNLILGIVIGAVVVGIVWMASRPAATEGQSDQFNQFACKVVSQLESGVIPATGERLDPFVAERLSVALEPVVPIVCGTAQVGTCYQGKVSCQICSTVQTACAVGMQADEQSCREAGNTWCN